MLSEIIEKGENEKVEFKETFRYDIDSQSKNKALKKEVTKAICGLLNSQGGMVLIGVSDGCKVKGLNPDLKLYKGESAIKNRDNLLKDINSTCREHLGTRVIGLLTISYETVEEEEIILIEISPSDEPVFCEDKIFYLRNGPATIQLEGRDLTDYSIKHFGRNESQKEQLGEKFKNLYNRLASKDPEYVIIDVKSSVEDIGKINLGKILKMEYIIDSKERIMLMEHNKWNLSIKTRSSPHLRLIKYINGDSQTYDFEIPDENEDILNEFLNLIKDRCKKNEIF
ncbi:hypothetical protein LCGC14_0578660 [marine sediment metagenome]|uniref:Schlafen AlbA-2 domain-containing protein n=1 Tax=marine sediment metagenome TaxID=412755 RepID=A0A0F9U3E9_9ZZZZ|nr:ATP-binding protein [bacterium]